MSRASAAHIRTADPLQSRAGNPDSCTTVKASEALNGLTFLFCYCFSTDCILMVTRGRAVCVEAQRLFGHLIVWRENVRLQSIGLRERMLLDIHVNVILVLI